MKKILKWSLIPLAITTTTILSAACQSEFDSKGQQSKQIFLNQATDYLNKYTNEFNKTNAFLNNQNSNKLSNFEFFYKSIQQKASTLAKAFETLNNYVNDSNYNFNLKQQLKDNFYLELNLSENQIKSYNDAYYRFNAINTELDLLAKSVAFNDDTNVFKVFKDDLNSFVNIRRTSTIFDRQFSNKNLDDAKNEYKNKWYNSSLKSIDYTTLGKKIVVDGNSTIEHTHAIGNVVKEWSVIVADQNSAVNDEFKKLIGFLTQNSEQIDNDEIKNLVHLISVSYDEYLKSIQEINAQFGGVYPFETFLGYFDENSSFSEFIKIWTKINEIYIDFKG
ncbi:MAG0770 family lipoprotein [Mycoplasmopsis columboralis]|uniref:Lipoprotein n=1 Tax=Mycoplasmopsis columboralis TaxID=171282 RepID=A0A449B5U7_9BACT|nr:hypothetical protein [Mycoplasmopsis columboralis]VEU75983.1 Uncharacterised protein [Mycoplasmopsis columboralis]